MTNSRGPNKWEKVAKCLLTSGADKGSAEANGPPVKISKEALMPSVSILVLNIFDS